ncbi:MAG: metabolite traffic protein EboE [Cyanobacteria bacterium P01_G01_bin.49]
MKIGHGFHLTYCTNIHPGESWQEVFANLKQYLPVLKTRRSPTSPFGIGLRLAEIATGELLLGNNLAQFQTWLAQEDLYVFTLNGFPYGGFHRQIVKDEVYAPDWSKKERLDYTLRLVKILATLLPEGMDGGISTLPLSYKPWWTGDKTAEKAILQDSSVNLALLVAEMVNIREKTGKQIHLDIEPEPDGLIENTAEVINFFKTGLWPIGGAYLAQQLGVSQETAEDYLREHIKICYDTCHFAVEYEEPASAFAQLQAAGIQIGKIQLSAALQVRLPDDIQARDNVVEHLRPFAESTYLHQAIARQGDGTLHRYRDLVTALPYFEQSTAEEWRTHFHVPIFIRDYQILQSTQDHIVAVLELLRTNPICQHLEIETYTWEVLPSAMKLDVLASIEREYEWVLATFAKAEKSYS